MCWEDVKNVETFLSNFLHLFPSKIIFSLQLKKKKRLEGLMVVWEDFACDNDKQLDADARS